MILLYILGGALGLFLLYVLFMGVCALLVDPGREYENDSRFYRFLLNFATAWILKMLRVRVRVTGMEKLPKDQKILFVGNHRSNYDPIVTWYAFKNWRMAFVSKPANFQIPFFGRIIRKCCFLPIDRENPRNAIVTINKAAQLLKRQEVSVGVYPEGTRSKNCQLLPFHNGVFKIAQKSETPIAVVSVMGTEKIAKRTPFRSTEVFMDVLDVIPAEEVKRTKTEQLGTTVRCLIVSNIDRRNKNGKRICDL